MEDKIEINLSHIAPFEASAALISVLAHPADGEARSGLMASLCHLVLKGAFLGGSEAEQVAANPIKPIYAFRSDDDLHKDLKLIGRLLRDRMIAAQMALPLIMHAEGKPAVEFPEGLSKLSLNELAVWAMEKVPPREKMDSDNVGTRIWRPSLPVIHLASALAVIIQQTSREGRGEINIGQVLTQPWITREVVHLGERYETLIQKGDVLPGKPVSLVKFRLFAD